MRNLLIVVAVLCGLVFAVDHLPRFQLFPHFQIPLNRIPNFVPSWMHKPFIHPKGPVRPHVEPHNNHPKPHGPHRHS